MSVVEIRCPNCGAKCSSRDKGANEYHCEHCGTAFRFVDTTKREVIQDIRGHNCSCGRPIRLGEGYVCTECGRKDFCSECVAAVSDRIVCKECIKNKGLIPTRLVCGVCGSHSLTYVSDSKRWYCQACKTYPPSCPHCTGPLTFVEAYGKWYCHGCKTYTQPAVYACYRCGGPLSFIKSYGKWYCYKCHIHV
jgi:hypothetical protein